MSSHSTAERKRESPWLVMRRCLAIMRRLQRGPADKAELLAAVYAAEGEGVYGGSEGEALAKRFEGDCRRIREALRVDIGYSRPAGGYFIRSLDQPLLALPDDQLKTLAFLAETFKPDSPHAADVRQLIDTLSVWLGPAQRQVVERARGLLDIDLRQRDSEAIAADVWAAVQEAYSSRQQLQFDYRSSKHEDGLVREHIVEPWEYYFDTERGHYYLRGYCLFNGGPNGRWYPNQYSYYRLGRIVPGTAKVLPTKLPPTPRAAERHLVIYELAPVIARFGVSRRPELLGEPKITAMDEGWVRVEGQTDDVFRLARNLLYYGDNCRVLGDRELLKEMRGLVGRLAEMYR